MFLREHQKYKKVSNSAGTRELVNAVVGWGLIVIVAVSAVASLFTSPLLWSVFAVIIAVVASLPALTRRDWTVTLPWPLLAVAAFATVGRVAGIYREAAGYLAIVALALIVVIEIDVFTPVKFSRRFAVVFSIMVTMALEGVWIIAQSLSDRMLGSNLLTSQTELQWDIVLVTVLAVVVGVLYHWYAIRFDATGSLTNRGDGIQ